VLGAEAERSVVTGRLAREVESDEGVEGFVGRELGACFRVVFSIEFSL
jgi:hypothetical protein